MCSLIVNETKVTLRNAFTEILFVLESEKESKNYKKTFFRDYLRILDLSVNLLTSNATYKWFVKCFSLSYFLATSGSFCTLKLSSLNCELNFVYNKSIFSRLYVLLRSKSVQWNWLRSLKYFNDVPSNCYWN